VDFWGRNCTPIQMPLNLWIRIRRGAVAMTPSSPLLNLVMVLLAIGPSCVDAFLVLPGALPCRSVARRPRSHLCTMSTASKITQASVDVMDQYTVLQLRQKLRARGLPIYGRKAQLIERLVEARREVKDTCADISLSEGPSTFAKDPVVSSRTGSTAIHVDDSVHQEIQRTRNEAPRSAFTELSTQDARKSVAEFSKLKNPIGWTRRDARKAARAKLAMSQHVASVELTYEQARRRTHKEALRQAEAARRAEEERMAAEKAEEAYEKHQQDLIHARKNAEEQRGRQEEQEIAAREAQRLAEEQRGRQEEQEFAAREAQRLAEEQRRRQEEQEFAAREAHRLAEEQEIAAREAQRLAEEQRRRQEEQEIAAREAAEKAALEAKHAEKQRQMEADRLRIAEQLRAEADRRAAVRASVTKEVTRTLQREDARIEAEARPRRLASLVRAAVEAFAPAAEDVPSGPQLTVRQTQPYPRDLE